MGRLASAAVASVLAAFVPVAAARAAGPPPSATAPFDYYVMALSWSPGFCDLGGRRKSPRQCAAGAGYGFVVHGLWPDNRFGPDPADCESEADISSVDLAAAQGLYATDSLAAYEYRKHGTCTGLDRRLFRLRALCSRPDRRPAGAARGPRLAPHGAGGDPAGLHRRQRQSQGRQHRGDLHARRTHRRADLRVEKPQGLRDLSAGGEDELPARLDRRRAAAVSREASAR